MCNAYEKVEEEFNKRGCILLTTKEEHKEFVNISKKCNYKLYYNVKIRVKKLMVNQTEYNMIWATTIFIG